MKVNERVQISQILGPTVADGMPLEVTGITTYLCKTHAIVRLTNIPQGLRIYVTRDGNQHLITEASRKTAPKDSTLLSIGDESAFALADLCPIADIERDTSLTLAQAKERAGGKYAQYVEDAIERGTITPLKGNRFHPADIDTVVTCCKNFEAEQQRSAAHQDRLRLARNYVNAV